MARESRADEFRDPAKVRAWLLEQREHVASYLADQGVRIDAPPVPEWDLAPYVAVGYYDRYGFPLVGLKTSTYLR